MSFHLEVEEQASFLHIRVSGENTPETLQQYLAKVYTECTQRGYSRVLIEERLSGPSLNPADIYRIIHQASSLTSPVVKKIAYIDTNAEHLKGVLDLGEAVAQDRGANVRTFQNLVEAIEWVESEPV